MKYECPCGYIYDPEVGDPDSGIAASPPAPPGKISRKTGYAPSAGSARTLLPLPDPSGSKIPALRGFLT